MAIDWKSQIQHLYDELTSLKESRECYFEHVILFFPKFGIGQIPDGVPDVHRIHPGCNSVSKLVDASLPKIGIHRHLFLSVGENEADIDLFAKTIDKYRPDLEQIPNSLFPKIAIPKGHNRATESLLKWMYFVHRTKKMFRHTIFGQHIEYMSDHVDYPRGAVSSWNDSNTLAEFSAVQALTLGYKTSEMAKWHLLHEQSNLKIPDVISATIGKPMLYASFQIVKEIFLLDSTKPPKSHKTSQRFTDMQDLVLEVLKEHHGVGKQNPCFDPLTQVAMATLAGVKQPTASLTLTKMQEIINEKNENRVKIKAANWYQNMCSDRLILGILKQLEYPS